MQGESQYNNQGQKQRSWKLFLLLPRMLLHRPPGQCSAPKRQLLDRFARYEAEERGHLLAEAAAHDRPAAREAQTEEEELQRRADIDR